MKVLVLAGFIALVSGAALAETPTTTQLLDKTNRATDIMITALTEQRASVCPKRVGARVCQGKFDIAKVQAAAIGIELTIALAYASNGEKEMASASLAKVQALRSEFSTTIADLAKTYSE